MRIRYGSVRAHQIGELEADPVLSGVRDEPETVGDELSILEIVISEIAISYERLVLVGSGVPLSRRRDHH